MSFQKEIIQPDANSFVCCEIETEVETLRYSNRPVEEPDKHWEPLIQNNSLVISREMDPETQQISLATVSLTLNNRIDDNGQSHFAKFITSGIELENSPVHIYLKFERNGNWYSRKIYSGICSPDTFNDSSFVFKVKPNLQTKLGIMQRQVNDIDFPNAPADSIGKGLNIIPGRSANGTTGTVELIPAYENIAGGAVKLLIAQHKITELEKLFRLRNNQYLQLTSGFAVKLSDADDKGREISSVQVNSGHNQGDRYFADIKGIPGKGYVQLDGTNYLKIDAGDLNSMNFEKSPFTIEISVIPERNGQRECLVSHTGEAGEYGWKISRVTNGKIEIDLSQNGSDCVTATSLSSFSEIGQEIIIRAAIDLPGSRFSVNVNGEEQQLSWSGNIPDKLNYSGGDFNLGARNNSVDLFKGRINYAIVSSGYQQGENRSIDALEDIISEWAFTLDGLDLQGRNHLSNPGSAQFICQDYEKNPALTLRNILLAHDGFSSFDIDENSILQAAKDCHENGLDLEGIHGGVIPKSSGCVDGLQDRSEILQELARNFGHNLVPLASGKVGLKKIGSSNSDEKLVHYSSASNDFQNAFLTIQHNPLKRANEVRALLRHSHATSGNHEGYLRGYNQVSQEVFGKAEQQWNYSFQRDVKVLEKVLGPRISLRSGRAKMIIFSVPGFKGLQDGSDVGDVIKVTAPQTYGDFSNRKIMVTGKSVDLINGGVKFQGLTLDNQIGVVAFSSEETVVIPASESTFIGATEIPCSGNSFPYADANTSYGNLGFLMHGHHYAYSGVCANSSFGFGNVNWVSIITWQLNADDWENRTIKSIGIVLNVESIPSLRFESEGPFQTRSNWDGCSLHNSSKDLQSIHGSFNNYVTIADGNLDSLYKDEIGEFAVGTGKVHIPLNSRGKESFAKASVNENYGTSRVILLLKRFSKGDYTNAVKISSIHSSNYNNNPLAVVSYIT